MTGKSAKHIAKNASYLFVSQLVTWSLSFIVAILVPRHFGPSGVGMYHLAASLWNITALLIGFGVDVVITRTIARDQTLVSPLVTVGIVLRVVFHVVGYTTLVIFAHLMGYSAETIQLIYIFGVANLIFQIGHVCSAALYGLEQMGYLSLVGVLTELISTGGIILLVFLDQSIVRLGIISIVAGVARTSLLFYVLRISHPVRFEMRLSLAPWLLRTSSTILANRVVRNLYVQADVIFISLFVNEQVVGWYSAADTAFGSLLFVANVIGTAFFPTMARLQEQDPAALPRLARKGLRWLLLATVPMGLGTTVLATPLLVLVLGEEFRPSGLVLSGFGLVTILTSLNVFLAQILISLDRQNRLTGLMLTAVLLTLPIDFVLIPWTQANWHNGALGGVIAYLVTETLILGGSLWALPWNIFDKETTLYGLKVGTAGILMAGITWIFRQTLIIYPLSIGVVTYVLLIFVSGALSEEELATGRGLLQRIWQRMSQRMQRVLPKSV
ncbi:MAG TPA: flippase [Caldilineaceae bacterium]|nr:flippase [Caldilineaceae bacterium]